MASIYQIGLILTVSVGVLASALIIAWRDAGRDSGHDRKASNHNDSVRRRRWKRKPGRFRNRMF